jgi:hypothetical protein
MVMVMLALAVGTILALSFLASQSTSVAMATNANRQVQSRALAEDAAELVLAYLAENEDWRTEFTSGVWTADQSLHGGTLRFRLTDEDDGELANDASQKFVLETEGSYLGTVHRGRREVVPRSLAAPTIRVLLVADENAPSDQDRLKAALFESWNFNVVMIADDASASAYTAAIADADVIYVSEEASSSALGSKLVDLAVGVVCEEFAYNDDLKLNTGVGTYYGTTIDVTDNSHPVTAGLTTGEISIATQTVHLANKSGTLAPGGTTLAERSLNGSSALMVVDQGGELTDGSPAAGRRVALPFGGSQFDVGLLNANGKAILRNALTWAANLSSSSIASGVVTVGATPQTVSLMGFADPVVVCTPNLRHNSRPVVARVSNVTASGFSVRLVNPSGEPVVAEQVHYLVVEAGAHEVDGVKFEAQRYTSTVTDENGSWGGEPQTYLHTYTAPVVVGQVMSEHDADWSVFWSRGDSKSSPPSGSSLFTGKHVGEDPDTTRADETVGFIVFESGTWSIDGHTLDASLSSDHVTGVQNDPPHWVDFGSPFAEAPSVVVADVAAMDGSDGGFAVLYGPDPISASGVGVAVDEDQLNDSDRSHTTEQISVIALGGSATGGDAPSLVGLYEFSPPTPVDPNLVAHWKLDEPVHQAILASGDRISLSGSGRVDAYDRRAGAYDANQTTMAYAVTHQTNTSVEVLDARHSSSFNGRLAVAQETPSSSITIVDQAQIVGGVIDWLDPVSWTMPHAPTATSNTIYTINNTDVTLDSDLVVKKFNIRNGATVTIDGDVTIEAMTDGVEIKGAGSQLIIPPGSSLTIHAGKAFKIFNDARVNADSLAADRLTVYLHGVNFRLNGGAVMAGRIYSEDGLDLGSGSTFYGSVLSEDDVSVSSENVHLDQGTSVTPAVFAENDLASQPGYYRHGAAAGAPGFGDGGTAAQFQGDDDFVQAPHDAAHLLDEGTLSFWFRADDLTGTQGLIAKDSNGYDDGGHIRVYLSGATLSCRLQSDSASTFVSTSGVSAHTWHHVAVGFGPGGLKLYLDGVLQDSDAYAGGLGTSSGGAGNQEPWTFGVDQQYSGDRSTEDWNHPFAGRIDDVRLYDQNFEEGQAANVQAGNPPGTSTPPLVEDSAGAGTPLDLSIDDPSAVTWTSDGLRIDAAVTIASPGAAADLHAALTETDTFTLEAEFTPANLTQDGPARLVAFGDGTSSRNLELGQSQAAYGGRLRTIYHSDGTPDAASGSVLTTQRQHVVMTYNGSELRLYRDGALEVAQPWEGSLDNWDAASRLALANVIGGGRPWLGTLHRVAIWDGPVNTIQVSNLFNGDPPGPPTAVEGYEYLDEWIESP